MGMMEEDQDDPKKKKNSNKVTNNSDIEVGNDDKYGDTFLKRLYNLPRAAWDGELTGRKDPNMNMIRAQMPDLPFGPGGVVRVLKNVKNVRKIVVNGENMADNVIPYAKRIGATWFKPTSLNPANWMKNQANWIRKQIKDPYTQIIDIGRDINRSQPSKYYLKDLEMIKKYLGL